MKPKNIIKDFEIFKSGSYAYNLSKEIESEEEIKQFLKELNKVQEIKR